MTQFSEGNDNVAILTETFAMQQKAFNQAQQLTGIGVWQWNLDTSAFSMSDNLYRLLGCEPGAFEPTLDCFLQYVHTDDVTKLTQPDFNELNNDIFKPVEFRIIRRDGVLRYARGTGSFYINNKGEKIILGTTQDITDDYLLKKELQERTAFSEMLVENSIDVILAIDKDFRITAWNKKSELKYNLKKEHALGKHLGEVMPYFLNDPRMADLAEAMNGKSFTYKEREYRKGNGYYDCYYIPIAYPDNSVHGVLIIIHDITEEKRIKDELERRETVLTEAQKIGGMGSWEWNFETGELRWSDTLFKIYSMDNNTSVVDFKDSLKVFYPDDAAMILNAINHSKETGEPLNIIYRRYDADGHLKYLHSKGVAIHNEGGKVTGMLGVTFDITERKMASDRLKEMNSKLEQNNKELAKSNNELESFCYVASHDLQEPLRKIQTFSKLITDREAQNLSDAGKDYFNRMASAAKRMQQLLDDLLTFSRTNTMTKVFERVDLNVTLNQVRFAFRETIEEKRAVVKAGNLPIVNGIAFQLQQLFENLISNALKYSKAEVAPVIQINCSIISGTDIPDLNTKGNKQYYQLTFTDNGIGFEPQYAERIFELFQRLHGKSEYPGTGLGLAICRRIIDNHYGLIKASGQPNVGTIITVYLPAD